MEVSHPGFGDERFGDERETSRDRKRVVLESWTVGIPG